MGVMSEIPGTALTPVQNDHLDWLEAESSYIIREVVACLLYTSDAADE